MLTTPITGIILASSFTAQLTRTLTGIACSDQIRLADSISSAKLANLLPICSATTKPFNDSHVEENVDQIPTDHLRHISGEAPTVTEGSLSLVTKGMHAPHLFPNPIQPC
jgi:hypothetical protein